MRTDADRFLSLSRHTYALLLLLYPREIRHEFGQEMLAVFADDLRDSWRTGQILGVANAWRIALVELVTVALPMHLRNGLVIISAVSLSLLYFELFIGFMPQ